MNILLAAATVTEIKPFLNSVQLKPITDLDILITGPGLTVTCYHLLKQCQLKRPELIIQAGIAGSFNKMLETGSVVAVNKDCVADEGAWEEETFKSLFDLGFRKASDPPFNKEWLTNPNTDLINLTGLKVVNAISVNQVTTDPQTIDYYQKKYSASVESMEGAALHYVCLMENIPFVQIRSTSNYIGERNKEKWKIEEAIANLNLEIEQLVTALQT